MLLEAPGTAEPTPTTNRGVYPHQAGWSASAFDYARATIHGADVQEVIDGLTRGLSDLHRPVTSEPGGPVPYYSSHIALTDRLGRVLSDVFWGGQNGKPNVEAKGANAALVFPIIRRMPWKAKPSRVDVKRDGAAPGLWLAVRSIAFAIADRHGMSPPQEVANHHPDKGDTLYLGARTSQVMVRIYQPGLKLAQAEGRTGDDISTQEREAVRVELEFKPEKQAAKLAAATLSPDQMWGVSTWSADLAGEVFAMNVQHVSISERRESDRNRALRFMATQYRSHLESLLAECHGDISLAAATIFDLADIPYTH